MPDFELTPDLIAELLDPESWHGILALYARTMKLAVALLDADGQLVGICHNPQPIWSLIRAARPDSTGDCLFCLESSPKCSAAADAVRTKSLTLVHDQGGFTHLVLPLILGGQHLGMLLAGQILGRYPEPLPLQRLAREFGVSAQQLWHLARQQVPMSEATLTVYGELLAALARTVLRDRYGAILGRRWVHTTQTLNRELATVNSTLSRKVAELDRSLIEKETLLKEVHHRVKNNLQVVSSLLSLQIEAQGESTASAPLRDAFERMHSMSLVHEHIYHSKTLAALDFGEYIENLANHLYQSYCPDRRRIRMTVATDETRLTIDQAIPCGLILNELISNAFKHAFNNGRDGLLEVKFRKTSDHDVELMVGDNGAGLPTGFYPEAAQSMGMQVVQMLTYQLEARLQISQANGTQFILSWRIPDARPHPAVAL